MLKKCEKQARVSCFCAGDRLYRPTRYTHDPNARHPHRHSPPGLRQLLRRRLAARPRSGRTGPGVAAVPARQAGPERGLAVHGPARARGGHVAHPVGQRPALCRVRPGERRAAALFRTSGLLVAALPDRGGVRRVGRPGPGVRLPKPAPESRRAGPGPLPRPAGFPLGLHSRRHGPAPGRCWPMRPCSFWSAPRATSTLREPTRPSPD